MAIHFHSELREKVKSWKLAEKVAVICRGKYTSKKVMSFGKHRFCSLTVLIQIIGFFKCSVTHSLSLAQLRQIAEGKFYFKWVLESLIDRRKVESLIDCRKTITKVITTANQNEDLYRH